jgi:hypothetical protein
MLLEAKDEWRLMGFQKMLSSFELPIIGRTGFRAAFQDWR